MLIVPLSTSEVDFAQLDAQACQGIERFQES